MIRAKRDVRSRAQRDGRIDARQLFHQNRVIDVAVACSTEFFREYRAQHTHTAKLAEHFERELLRLIPLHHVRPDFGLGEFAKRFPELMLLWGVAEVHWSVGRREDVRHYTISSFLGSQRNVRPKR